MIAPSWSGGQDHERNHDLAPARPGLVIGAVGVLSALLALG